MGTVAATTGRHAARSGERLARYTSSTAAGNVTAISFDPIANAAPSTTPHASAERGGPVRLLQYSCERGGVLENLPIRHDPLVISHELVPYGRRSHDSRNHARYERGLPRSYRETCRRAVVSRCGHSHSMVAGGLELTS